MAIYAFGDIQGCYSALQRLLDKLHYDPGNDQLWFVGDLVNRGEDSLSTLRFVKSLGNSAITVLGNHDLHLLAVAHNIRNTKDPDLLAILHDDDAGELLHWLSQRPLIHVDHQHQVVMAHAGIYPGWTLPQAEQYAHELQQVLKSEKLNDFLENMYGDLPDRWNENLQGYDRLRFICNCFTRMRYFHPDGRMEFNEKLSPEHTDHLLPWYTLPGRKAVDYEIIFGHWSTLHKLQQPGLIHLDTGCVWGGRLTAIRIDTTSRQRSCIDCH